MAASKSIQGGSNFQTLSFISLAIFLTSHYIHRLHGAISHYNLRPNSYKGVTKLEDHDHLGPCMVPGYASYIHSYIQHDKFSASMQYNLLIEFCKILPMQL